MRRMLLRCAWCGRYDDPDGVWRKHRGRQPVDTSHGICPDCLELMMPTSAGERPTQDEPAAPDRARCEAPG